MLSENSSFATTMSSLKLVLRSHIFCQRFDIVAPLAQRLPVRLVPEQLTVATVRNDVVYHSGWCQLALSFAHDAQRVSAKKRFTDSPPTSVVDVVLNPTVVLPLSVGMGFTVTPPCVRKTWATGNGTRTAAFIWHKDHPFHSAMNTCNRNVPVKKAALVAKAQANLHPPSPSKRLGHRLNGRSWVKHS